MLTDTSDLLAIDDGVGDHTLLIRRAFGQVQKRQKARYRKLIAVLAVGMTVIAGYSLYQQRQLAEHRQLATELFYDMKSLDVDLASLERSTRDSDNSQELAVIHKYRERREQMEKRYDALLSALSVYNPKMTEQQKLIMRMARVFGECELDMPPDFVPEVNKYIGYWRSSGRFARDVKTANDRRYTTTITQELLKVYLRNSSTWRCKRAILMPTSAGQLLGKVLPRECGSLSPRQASNTV